MSDREAFERILASLHEAALDREVWSTATGLIDDALRTHGSCMVFGDGTSDEDARIYFAWCIMRGQRNPELERAYFEDYWRRDERVPRMRHLPDGQLFHNTELYTKEELKTSAAYNELLARHHGGNAIVVRLDGPDDTRIVWVVNDPIDGDRWSSDQLKFIRYLLPHIRQTVHMQQALAGAGALGASHGQLLDTTGLGIVQLDARARIVAANDRARDLLRRGEALFDEHGFLHARMPEEDAELQGLLTRALPPYGAQGAGGSTMLSRSSAPPLVLHVNPVGPRESGARVWPVAALVLVIDPASQSRIDPGRGGGGSRAHGDGGPGGGAVGRRHEHSPDCRGHGPREKHDPHASEAHVRQARRVASGGPDAACPVGGPRFGVPALKAQGAGDRR